MDASQLTVVARDVGVRYDLRFTRRRTFRQAFADAVGKRPVAEGPTTFWALKDVTFTAEHGDVIGVIGRNGSGKSTLLLTIAGILRPDTGIIRTFGRPSTLLTIGAGFEPDLTGRENIYLNGALLGFPRQFIERRMRQIIRFSELDRFIDVPLRTYSTGMRARLGFSIAVHTEPDILLIDELLGVGDEGFRQKSRAKLDELMQSARGIVVVSHDMTFVKTACTKAIWLDEGRVAAAGPAEDVVDRYVTASQQQQGTAVRTFGESRP